MSSNDVVETPRKPVVIITIGMAGSGKTTFVQRVNSYLRSTPALDQPQEQVANTPVSERTHPRREPRAPYLINLDPAVSHMPFDANIDIRETIDYAGVMKQYNLGPNGGILTALNLFTTKFDQVLDLMEKRSSTIDYIVLDTPGQIEIFTWSASGAIITDAVAASFPTVVAYVIDTARTTAPATFMSNMLYACSILYKTKLPFILVYNKTDVQPHDFAIEWMTDFEAFQRALSAQGSQNEATTSGDGDPNYMDSLMHSMSLVLDEFYQHLKAVGVSSVTGDGMPAFFAAVEDARLEYEKDYLPELRRLENEKAAKAEANKEDSMRRLMVDLKMEEQDRRAQGLPVDRERFGDSDEDRDEEDDDSDGMEQGGSAKDDRYMDLARARRVKDPAMEADGSKWPRPGR